MAKRLWAALLALCLWTGGARGARAAEQQRALTVMVYLCGSNLESSYGAASSDLQEMIASGFDQAAVSMLVMAGGTSFWSMGFNTEELSICQIGKRGLRVVSCDQAQSMGSVDTLVRLIDYGVENFPAENYALILWDHGGGPLEGVCWDELFSMENLSLKELTQALKASKLPKKLAFIGFDACLMGSVEVASALSPYASYMISSQETEPAQGWNYAFLKDIETAADGAEIGRRVVDAYFDGLGDSRDLLTLSCVDLSRVQALEAAMDACFGGVARTMNRDLFSRLSDVRLSAGDFGSPVRAAGEEGYDLTDLGALAERLGNSDAVLDALSDAVVYCRASVEDANGLSVYHPFLNKNKYAKTWKDAYGALGFCPGYSRYVRQFATLLLARDDVDWMMPPPTATEAGANERLSLALTDEQAQHLSSARLLIFRQLLNPSAYSDTGLTLVWSEEAALSGNTGLTADYGWDALYLVDAAGDTLAGPVSYMPDEDGSTFILPALYWTYDDSDYLNVRHYLVRNGASPEAQVERTYVYDSVVQAFTNRAVFSEADYDTLNVWRPIVLKPYEAGLIPGFDEWETHPGASMPGFDLSGPWHGRVIRERSAGARLYAAFEVTDVQQNRHCSPLVELFDPAITPVAAQPSSIDGGALKAAFSVTVFSGRSEPRVELTLEAENPSDKAYKLSSSNFVVNGTRATSKNWFASTMEPGARCETTAEIDGVELYGIDAIEEISCTMILRDPDDYSSTETFDVTLRLEDCDVRPLWDDGTAPLGQGRSEKGVSARLISLDRQGGAIRGWLLLRNDSGAALDGHQKLALNGVIADSVFWSYLEPGMESVESLQFDDAATLTWGLKVLEGSDVNYLAKVDRVLARFGDGDVHELALYLGVNDSDGTIGDRLTIALDTPAALADGGGMPEQEPRLLLSRDGVDARVGQLFLAADGLALGLVLENRTDADHALFLEDASLAADDSALGLWSMARSWALPARTTSVVFLTLNCSGDLLALPAGASLALSTRWRLDDSESVPAPLPLPQGASFAKPHGMVIE